MSDLGLDVELVGLSESEEFEVIKGHLQALWAHTKKGTQVKMCRFGNWVDQARERDQTWTWFLLRLVHYALSENLLDGCDWEQLFKPSGAAQASSGEERVEMTRSNDVVRHYRSALKSNVQLSLAMLLDPTTRSKTRMLYLFVAPLREWYGRQNTALRSCPALLKFLKQQIGERAVNQPYRDMLKLLSDSDILDKIGLRVGFTSSYEVPDADHPWLAEQDQVADMAAQYVCGLVCSRFTRLQYLTHGWAGRQVEFLFEGKDEAAGQALMSEHAEYLLACQQTLSFWKKVCQRSYFLTVPVQQLLQMLHRKGRKVSPELRSHIESRLSGIGQSKVSEDAMNKGRRWEHSAANKQALTPKALWARLLESGLTSEVFHYDEVTWQGQVAPVGEAAALPRSVFHVSLRESPKWVGNIVGTSAKPPWFTTTATFSNVIYADNFLLQTAQATGD